jgi:phosphatidylserine decarboxylase
MTQPYTFTRRSAYNFWVPQSNRIHDDFIREVLSPASESGDHKDAVKTFDKAVSKDHKKLFASALTQVQQFYDKWADVSNIAKDWEDFLNHLDNIVESPPRFYKTKTPDDVVIGEPVALPVYLILDLISNTSAAYILLTDPDFNKAIKDLLNSWGEYLKTKDSAKTLNANEDGWFNEQALAILQSGLGGKTFDETYKVDHSDYPKYDSWDRFFAREFKNDKVRPVQPSTQNCTFVNNACESTVLRVARNVQIHDTFWLKEQNYSLYDILGGKQPGSLAPFAKYFEGGSVYQAFLGPQDYHRWHSPVTGKIVASNNFDGSYYAALPDNGAPPYDTDLEPGDPHGALVRSQPWLSVVSARAVYIIKPHEEVHLEWVALIGIGMGEVSTCEITKPLGDVNAGDPVGSFHFGGSTHALLLKPKTGYEIIFQDVNENPVRPGQHRWINSGIAQVRKIKVTEPRQD